MLNSEFGPGQTDARGVLVILLFNVPIGSLSEDVFTVGSFAEHRVVLPSQQGGRKTCTPFYLCLLLPWLLVRRIL